MAWLANPNWAAALILAGILLVYAEFTRPGTILLGCGGALAVMLGIWGLGHSAVSVAGLGFVALGMLLVALSCVPKLRFVAAFAGAGCLCWGLIGLTRPAIHAGVALLMAVIFTAVTRELGRIALLAAHKKQVPGPWDRDWGHPAAIRRGFKE